MKMAVRQLAELVHGTFQGDGDLVIQAARTLQEAQAGDITFLENARHEPRLHQSQASAAIVPAAVPLNGKALIHVADPLMAFIVVVQHFQGKGAAQPTGVDPRAVVHSSAQIGADASIDPLAVVGANTVIGKRCRLHSGVVVGKNCRLGDDVVLYPNVVLYDDILVGDRVIIHANAVIGADGFGYRFQQGRHVKVPQLGGVEIGNDVEIGAGTAIDRGTFEATSIGEGTKIDNLVQIAHNCRIGKHNVFAAQVGIAGSCSTGNHVIMGGQVGIADHVHIGDGVAVGAQSGLHKDVPAGKRMFGSPAQEETDAARILACCNKLPGMRKNIQLLLKHLNLQEHAA
jgi:UDP-3-O-[3-hydroxymyristoyl] glucosamine N-acyltransferase